MSNKNDDCKIVFFAQIVKDGKVVSTEELSSTAFTLHEPESMEDIMEALNRTEAITADARKAMAGYTFKKLTSGTGSPKKKTRRK